MKLSASQRKVLQFMVDNPDTYIDRGRGDAYSSGISWRDYTVTPTAQNPLPYVRVNTLESLERAGLVDLKGSFIAGTYRLNEKGRSVLEAQPA